MSTPSLILIILDFNLIRLTIPLDGFLTFSGEGIFECRPNEKIVSRQGNKRNKVAGNIGRLVIHMQDGSNRRRGRAE